MRTEIPIVVLGASGSPILGASCQVNMRGSAVAATVYQAATGGLTFGNPLSSDSQGRVSGWLERGQYDCVISASGLSTYTEPYESVPGADGGIDTAWLADLGVTTPKIAAGAITSAKLASGVAAANIDAGSLPATALSGYPADATRYLRGDGTWPVLSLTVPRVTSLPGSPTDGQEVILVDSLTAATFAWRLQYVAGSTNTDKWEFIGGSDRVYNDDGANMGSLTSASYADFTRVASLPAAPRSGVYELFGGVGLSGSNVQATTLVALKLGSAATSDSEVISGTGATGGGGWGAYNPATPLVRTLAAGDVVKAQYKTASGAANFQYIRLACRPVRLS